MYLRPGCKPAALGKLHSSLPPRAGSLPVSPSRCCPALPCPYRFFLVGQSVVTLTDHFSVTVQPHSDPFCTCPQPHLLPCQISCKPACLPAPAARACPGACNFLRPRQCLRCYQLHLGVDRSSCPALAFAPLSCSAQSARLCSTMSCPCLVNRMQPSSAAADPRVYLGTHNPHAPTSRLLVLSSTRALVHLPTSQISTLWPTAQGLRSSATLRAANNRRLGLAWLGLAWSDSHEATTIATILTINDNHRQSPQSGGTEQPGQGDGEQEACRHGSTGQHASNPIARGLPCSAPGRLSGIGPPQL